MLYTIIAAGSSTNTGMSTIWVAIVTGAATLAGSWLLFRGQGKQAEAESVVEERKLLAAEWGKVREAVDKALEDCRIERDELKGEIDRLANIVNKQARTIRRLEADIRRVKTLGENQGDEIRHMRTQADAQSHIGRTLDRIEANQDGGFARIEATQSDDQDTLGRIELEDKDAHEGIGDTLDRIEANQDTSGKT